MLGVNETDLKATRLQNLKQGYPIHAGRFHCHSVDAALREPVGESLKVFCKCGKRSHRFRIAVRGDRYKDLSGNHVHPSRIGCQFRQMSIHFPRLLSVLGHDSSPMLNSATSQAHEMETISQAGSSQSNNDCVSPMLLRAGLGSDSLTGSEAPLGIRPTLTVTVSPVLQNPEKGNNAKSSLSLSRRPAGRLWGLLGKEGSEVHILEVHRQG